MLWRCQQNGYDSVELIISQIKEFGLTFITLIANSEDSGKPHNTVATVPTMPYFVDNKTFQQQKQKRPQKFGDVLWQSLTYDFISFYGNVKLDPAFVQVILLIFSSTDMLYCDKPLYFPDYSHARCTLLWSNMPLAGFPEIALGGLLIAPRKEEFFPLGFLIGTYSYLVYTVGIWVWWTWDDGPIRRCCRKKYKHVEE